MRRCVCLAKNADFENLLTRMMPLSYHILVKQYRYRENFCDRARNPAPAPPPADSKKAPAQTGGSADNRQERGQVQIQSQKGGGSVLAAVALAAAGVLAAAVIVVMAVVVAMNVGVIAEGAAQQGLHRLVGRAGHPAEQADARLGQGRLGAAADAAADQDVCLHLAQQPGQSAVALAVGAHHLAGDHLAVFHLIELELRGMAEMLEHLAVLIGNCDFHDEFLSMQKVKNEPCRPMRNSSARGGRGGMVPCYCSTVSGRMPEGSRSFEREKDLGQIWLDNILGIVYF